MKNLNTTAPPINPRGAAHDAGPAGAVAPINPPGKESTPSATPAVDPVVVARAKLLAEAEALQAGLNMARAALGHALRVMIANQFHENDGGRRIAENTFERCKNIPEGKGARDDLDKAAAGLTDAVNHIANHSLKFPGDLDQLRSSLQKVNLARETITAPETRGD